MSSTDLASHGTAPSTALTIADDQSTFTENQVAVLSHMGVEGASDGDLAVFFHVVKRTGLDPFAKQIYMIGRNTFDQRRNSWVTKWTIQTGIDGYRLIGRRAANAARVRISIGAPEWAHQDGTWRPVWVRDWGLPIAARVTITRDGEPFTAVALFDEYKQTKRDGELNQMWSQRPAGQIAKCAEALAWRMAFPQDLAGIYVDDEMQQADREEPALRSIRPAAPVTAAEILGDEVDQAFQTPAPDAPPAEDVQDAEVVEEPKATRAQRDRLGRALKAAGAADKDVALPLISGLVGRPVPATTDLTQTEIEHVLTELAKDAQRPIEGADGWPPVAEPGAGAA